MDINTIKSVVKKALLSERFLIKMAALVIILLLLKRSILSTNDVREFNTGVEDFSALGLLKYMKNNLGKKEPQQEPIIQGKDNGFPVLHPDSVAQQTSKGDDFVALPAMYGMSTSGLGDRMTLMSTGDGGSSFSTQMTIAPSAYRQVEISDASGTIVDTRWN